MGIRLFSPRIRKEIGRSLEEGHWSKIKLSSRFYHALHSLSRRSDCDISCEASAPVICQQLENIYEKLETLTAYS